MKIGKPLVKVLQLMDGEKLAMGYKISDGLHLFGSAEKFYGNPTRIE